MHTRHLKRSVLLPAVMIAACLLAVLAGLAVLTASPAAAQVTTSTFEGVKLDSDADEYPLSRRIYLTRDPFRQRTHQEIVERHMSGAVGSTSAYDLISLGSEGQNYWLVLKISNYTQIQDWVFSFGDRLAGRTGLIDNILVVKYPSETQLVNTLVSKGGTRPGSRGSVVDIPLFLPAQRDTIVVFYVETTPGAPVTIAPKLVRAQSYLQKKATLADASTLYMGAGLVAFGGLMIAAFLKRRRATLLMGVYFGLQIAYFLYQRNIFLAESKLISALQALFPAAVMMAGLFMTRYLFRLRAADKRRRGTFIDLYAALLLVSALSAVFLIEPASPFYIIFVYGTPIGAFALAALLSLAQAERYGWISYLTSGSWWLLLLSYVAGLLGISRIVDPGAFSLSFYWIGVLVQAYILIFVIWFLERKEQADTAQMYEDRMNETLAVSSIKHNKDASEISRLLRLIEHEREVMNQLREREMHQAEEMRIAKEAADEANRAKSAFLAVVSHEIRTPMTGVMGMIRLLLNTSLTKEQNEYAETIQDSGDAMMALLNDILDFEKIESGKLDLEYVDLDLRRLAQGVITLMSGHAEAKKIYLRLDMDTHVPQFIVGDPVRIRQVLLNLVGNAIKFTSEGGVTLSVAMDVQKKANIGKSFFIRFAVEDTGIGISKEGQKKLFSPFVQADKSITRKYGGTGLGLAISNRLIEAMGSQIKIESTEGKGSTFYFILNLEKGDARNAEDVRAVKEPAATETDRKMSILVAEDNDINRKLMLELVKRMGHEAEGVESGEAVIDLLKKETPFDVILMDIEMEGMSGADTTRAIRALSSPRQAATPVIALTGNVQEQDIESYFAANMNGHLAKPVDPRKLKEMLSKVSDNKLDNPVKVAGRAAARKPTVTIRQTEAGLGAGGESGTPADREVPDTARLAQDDADSDIIRKEVLEDIRVTMAASDLGDLIDSVFVKTDEIISAIEGALQGEDHRIIANRMHELRGMTGNFGLQEIALIAGKIEELARDKKIQVLPERIAELSEARWRARDALDRWLSQ